MEIWCWICMTTGVLFNEPLVAVSRPRQSLSFAVDLRMMRYVRQDVKHVTDAASGCTPTSGALANICTAVVKQRKHVCGSRVPFMFRCSGTGNLRVTFRLTIGQLKRYTKSYANGISIPGSDHPLLPDCGCCTSSQYESLLFRLRSAAAEC